MHCIVLHNQAVENVMIWLKFRSLQSLKCIGVMHIDIRVYTKWEEFKWEC